MSSSRRYGEKTEPEMDFHLCKGGRGRRRNDGEMAEEDWRRGRSGGDDNSEHVRDEEEDATAAEEEDATVAEEEDAAEQRQ